MPGKSKRTTIKAGEGLIALVREHGIGFDDLALSEEEEVIILKRKKIGYDDGASASNTTTRLSQ